MCVSFYSRMYGERFMTSSSRLFTPEDISQTFPDIGFTTLFQNNQSNYFFLSFFLFHFQQGSNKTQSKELKCCMYCRPYAKPNANNNLSVLEAYILVYQFSHIVCTRTQSNRNAKFSNPPTHTYIYMHMCVYIYIHILQQGLKLPLGF